MPDPRPCEWCGEPFVPAKRTRRFCSKRCSNLGAPRHHAKLPGTVYERHGERIKTERRERYATDPEYRARVLARVAGRRANPVPHPCERCGAEHADRHHDDYGRPEEVRWLCRSCHVREHVAERGSWGSGLTSR